jgi:hypothetical protein
LLAAEDLDELRTWLLRTDVATVTFESERVTIALQCSRCSPRIQTSSSF